MSEITTVNGIKKLPEDQISDLYGKLMTSLKEKEDPEYSRIRNIAYKKFAETGFPDFKHEEYRYTHIAQRIPQKLHFRAAQYHGNGRDKILNPIPVFENSIIIEFINGILITSLQALEENGEVGIKTIEKASKDNPDLIYGILRQEIELSKDPFVPLNTAFSREGLFIHIKENRQPGKDIYLIHHTFPDSSSIFTSNRHIILAGRNSSSRIAEIFFSGDQAPCFDIPFTSIHMEEGASLSYHKVQLLGKQAIHLNNTQVHQKKDSRFISFTITLSGNMIRNNLNIRLNESNCESTLYGLFYLSDSDHADNHTVVDHRMPHCLSNEYYKGILDGNSKGVFNGKIFVQPNAQKTNAYQSNKNILVSENASINTKPQLEIWADDVRCTHGTTTGKLDREQLFYLRSRGLSEKTAKSLLIHAFANDLVDKMEMTGVKSLVENKIRERLEQY
ncbi:MAG TPA: Fe-S cluster assembly protein SufD [Cyclobacteriaceae bacterium]|nr:Fe-S cluster assembly protein SufD [Cyclobacteriaceae bacterium]